MNEPILLPEKPSAEEMFPELGKAEVRKTFAATPDLQTRLDKLLRRYDNRYNVRLRTALKAVEDGMANRAPKPRKDWQRRFLADWRRAQRKEFEHLLKHARSAERESAFVERLEAEYATQVVKIPRAREILPHTNIRHLVQKGQVRGEYFEKKHWYYAVADLERVRSEDAEGVEKRRIAEKQRKVELEARKEEFWRNFGSPEE